MERADENKCTYIDISQLVPVIFCNLLLPVIFSIHVLISAIIYDYFWTLSRGATEQGKKSKK